LPVSAAAVAAAAIAAAAVPAIFDFYLKSSSTKISLIQCTYTNG
jgi:hypothetical protein